MATRGKGGRGQWGKEGEGSFQGTCINDPWTWTPEWGLTVGAGSGWAVESKGGNCDNCNRTTIKLKEERKKEREREKEREGRKEGRKEGKVM